MYCFLLTFHVGESVSQFKEGDWVIPQNAGLGTWQTAAVYKESDLMRISNEIPVEAASTLMVNPTTAYRMLKDFQDLKPGDCVIQNGANSGVGQAVIQIASSMGVKTINIVRKRVHIDKVKTELQNLGATLVITEEELRSHDGRLAVKGLSPKLALNCVGGRHALYLAASLCDKGKLVTYGGMSKQPLHVPTGPLIFNRIELHGFWMSKWYTFEENNEEKTNMFQTLTSMILEKKLHAPIHEAVPFENYEEAIKIATSGSGKKQIFMFD